MGQYEDETPTGKFTTKSTTDALEIYRKGLGIPTTTAEIFTVVYFMPNGDATLRYEKAPGSNEYLHQNAFAVARVIAGDGTNEPKLEWLKFRGDLGDVMQSLTLAHLKNESPGNCMFCGHEIMPERQEPQSQMDVSPAGSDGGSDGKIWQCVGGCFCSYGGCNPERNV